MDSELIDLVDKYILEGKEEEARLVLLEKGYYGELNSEVQKAYYKRFPPTPELVKELEGSLKQLFDKDPATRKKAADYINKQSRGEVTFKQRGWLRDPRTIEILVKALDDSDPKVVFEITNALGMIVQRYQYPDCRVYEALTKKFDQVDDEIKIKIAQAIASFKFKETWDYVLKTLKCTPSKVARHAVGLAVSRYGKNMDNVTRPKMLLSMIEAYKKEKNTDSKISLIKGIREIGDESILAELTDFAKIESNKLLKDEIQFTIKNLSKK